ncbi:hypothetical protein Hanom_Chr07g00594931 [Helianthus anomalus]
MDLPCAISVTSLWSFFITLGFLISSLIAHSRLVCVVSVPAANASYKEHNFLWYVFVCSVIYTCIRPQQTN